MQTDLIQETHHMNNQFQQELEIEISEFEYPYNKTITFIVFPPFFLMTLQQKQCIKQFECSSSDGKKFNGTIDFEMKGDSCTFIILYQAQDEQFDDSKIYKLTSTLISKNIKKSKDSRVTLKPLAVKVNCKVKQLEQQICLKNELQIETLPKYNSREEVGFCGLINNAATCYMNSVFQILFNIGAFQQLIYSIQADEPYEFPGTLQNLFHNLKNSKIAVSTQEIIKSFKWEVEQQAVQQDVQEFIMELLRALGSKANVMEEDIAAMFEGELENHIKNKHFDVVNTEKFMDIQLNITGSLDESLQLFTSTELLYGENSYHHETLGLQEAEKFHKFKKLPPILLLNLKRYQYQNGGFQKINDQFKYPDEIDFKQYMINGEQSVYYFYAVLVHRGDAMNHGHYYCFIKPFYGSLQWFKFDDKIVTRATHKEVFDRNFGQLYQDADYNEEIEQIITEDKTNPETAYMLVYLPKNQPGLLEIPQNIPQWIVDREQQHQEQQYQKKNFVQTNLITMAQLNKNTQFKTGIIYHKPALNSTIDLNEVEEFINTKSTPMNIPKNATVGQIIGHMTDLLSLNPNNLYLFLYRITVAQPDKESIIYLQPNKQLQSYLGVKFHVWALLLVSTSDEEQNTINKLGINQTIEVDGNNNIQVNTPITQPIITFIKIHNDNESTFMNPLVLERGMAPMALLQSGQYVDKTLYYQTQFELRSELPIEKGLEFYTIFIDVTGTLNAKLQDIIAQREVILKCTNDNNIYTALLNKNAYYEDLLEFILEQEDCSGDNIQIKYKDKKGSLTQALATQTIGEIVAFDKVVNYRQTVVPVGQLKDSMNFISDNVTYIVQKTLSVKEFMDQYNLIDEIPVLTAKKDIKSAFVLVDRQTQLSKALQKHNIRFVQPIVLGQDYYIICYIQSVDIRQIIQPLLIQCNATTSVRDVYSSIISKLSTINLSYSTQQLEFHENYIVSYDQDNKINKLDMQTLIKLNNQEVNQESEVEVGAIESTNKQLIMVITYLSIRDTKNDKYKEKGLQIL